MVKNNVFIRNFGKRKLAFEWINFYVKSALNILRICEWLFRVIREAFGLFWGEEVVDIIDKCFRLFWTIKEEFL